MFDAAEVKELEEYFGLKNYQEEPTSKEIQTLIFSRTAKLAEVETLRTKCITMPC